MTTRTSGNREDTARQSRNQSSKPYFTTEARSSQRSEYFLIKNSLLRALSASAVSSLLDRYNQNRHWKICGHGENFRIAIRKDFKKVEEGRVCNTPLQFRFRFAHFAALAVKYFSLWLRLCRARPEGQSSDSICLSAH